MVERDDLLLLLLTAVPIAAYVLLLYIPPQPFFAVAFDVLLFVMAFPLLFVIRDEHSDGILKFDENLQLDGVLLGFGLGFVTFILNVAVFSYSSPDTLLSLVGKQLSVVYIPTALSIPNLPLRSVAVGTFSVFLVAIAEEGLKAESIFGAFIPLQERFGEDSVPALILSAAWGIGIWSVLHTVKAGFGLEQVVMAFISGSIWFVGWISTKSLIVPIIGHASYDGLVLWLTVLNGSVAVAFVVIITVLAAVTMGLYGYSKFKDR